MNRLQRAIAAILIFFTGVSMSLGSPAWKGVVTLTQPDGTVIEGRLWGDEFMHVMTDLQGNALVQNGDGFWCYAGFSGDGQIYSSGIIAGKASVAPSSRIPYEILGRIASERRVAALRNTLTLSNKRALASEDGAVPHRHCLILLAEFSDVKMTHPVEHFEALINKGENCAKRYFEDQFLGECEFTFDIAPIVTLSNPLKYYGKNKNGSDERPHEAVAEACRLAHEKGIDFSAYDDDGDGIVDNVFVFVAGKDEADGGGDDCIWSHAWHLKSAGIDLVLDGKRIDHYAVSSELSRRTSGKFQFRTIGTFCHEYSHILGLDDMYDTDLEGSGGKSEALWKTTALMDGGNYNNEGRTPPYYNAIDRDMLGIGKPEELKEGKYKLEPVNVNGRFLKFAGQNPDEYYLIECRANNGWDVYCGGKGLAIYHIDKSSNSTGYSPVYERVATAAERWSSNEVNCRPTMQCADMMEAYDKAVDASQVFFPYARNNSFTPHSVPAFKFRDGSFSHLAITDILQMGDEVAFNVVRSQDARPSIVVSSSKDVYQNMAIIQWKTDHSDNKSPAVVSWGQSGKALKEEAVFEYEPCCFALRLEGLKPATAYTVKIHYAENEIRGKETTVNFTTRSVYNDGAPFIWFNADQRNDDGTFKENGLVPLSVCNVNNVQDIQWYMDGRRIAAGKNGYYELSRSCVITAVVTYVDGATDVIEKNVTIR